MTPTKLGITRHRYELEKSLKNVKNAEREQVEFDLLNRKIRSTLKFETVSDRGGRRRGNS